MDLTPTLSDLMGVSDLREDSRGRSLRPLLENDGELSGRLHYIVNAAPEYGGDAAVQGRFKLISSLGGNRLYDLASDPGEASDVAREHPGVVDAMLEQLLELRAENAGRREAHAARRDEGRLTQVADETLRQLRAMGYVE